MKLAIDLNELLKKRDGTLYQENNETIPVGKLFCVALDIASQQLTPEERRKRFWLACRIEDHMNGPSKDELWEFDLNDRKRIENAAELIWANHLFSTRIYEVLADAQSATEARRARAEREAKKEPEKADVV